MEPGGREHFDLRALLAAVAESPPVAAVDVLSVELAKRLGARDVQFLIADFSGDAVVRLTHSGFGLGFRSYGEDAAETVLLEGTAYEWTIRSQRPQMVPDPAGSRVLAPVTDRGDVIGVLELVVPEVPDRETLNYITAAAHAFGYVVIANRRFTDLFEWGQRSGPYSLAAEIQRRLLPPSLTCEAGQFTLSGALVPAGRVGGDSFDYSLDRDTLHVSLTDAMGHEVDAAILSTLVGASLRNSRRVGASMLDQATLANKAVLDHARPDQLVTGQLLRFDLVVGTAHMVNAGHPKPVRISNGQVEHVPLASDLPFGTFPGTQYSAQQLPLRPGDRILLLTDGLIDHVGDDLPDLLTSTRGMHPRETVRELTRAAERQVGGDLHDDATALCIDWYG